jgi:hypothetical protein
MSSTFWASIALRSRGRWSRQQGPEGQHLAEHGRRFRQRQRCRRHQRALLSGQYLVHTMAKLVRQRHHVARLAEIVDQHIGVHRRHRRMGECAGYLARTARRIDPAAVEETARNVGHFGRKAVVGGEHRVLGRVPGDRLAGCSGRGALRSQNSSLSSPSQPAFMA